MELNIFDRIALDLKMARCTEETPEQFYFRVSYSSIGFWIKSLIAANSVIEEEASINVNKAYIHHSITPLVDAYIRLCPTLEEFYDQEVDPVDSIRSVMLRAGEIDEIGFSTELYNALPKAYSAEGVYISTGLIKPDINGKAIGLSWQLNNKPDDINSSIYELFGIGLNECNSILDRYLSNARWQVVHDHDSLDFFNPYSNQVFSSCWQSYSQMSNQSISVARKPLSFGGYDYYLVKQANESCFIYKLPDYAKNENIQDVQKLLYAIKARAGANAICNVDRYSDHSIYHCWSRLPVSFDNIMRYIAWPFGGIKNQRNEYFVIKELVPLADMLLASLGVKLEVKNCE